MPLMSFLSLFPDDDASAGRILTLCAGPPWSIRLKRDSVGEATKNIASYVPLPSLPGMIAVILRAIG